MGGGEWKEKLKNGNEVEWQEVEWGKWKSANWWWSGEKPRGRRYSRVGAVSRGSRSI